MCAYYRADNLSFCFCKRSCSFNLFRQQVAVCTAIRVNNINLVIFALFAKLVYNLFRKGFYSFFTADNLFANAQPARRVNRNNGFKP